LDEVVEFQNPKSSTQEALTHRCHCHICLQERTDGKEPLMDYFQSHVMISKKIIEHYATKGNG